jgi:hypothetical protein
MRDYNVKPKLQHKVIHFNTVEEKEKFTYLTMNLKLSSGQPVGVILNEILESHMEQKRADRKSKKAWED